MPRIIRRKAIVRPARFPFASVMEYRAILRPLVAETRRLAREELAIHGPAMVAEAQRFRADAEVVGAPEATGWAAMLRDMLLRMGGGIGGRLRAALMRVEPIARGVDKVGAAEFRRQVTSAFGVNILSNNPGLPALLSAWEAENVALIRSIPDGLINSLRGEFTAALTNGAGLRDLTKIVAERGAVTLKRAELIAQDQVSKLNGRLAEHRQRGIGLTEFTWSTAGDERVRPAHVALDGKTFKWDKPPSEGRPGQPVRCRCIANPVFPEDIVAEGTRA